MNQPDASRARAVAAAVVDPEIPVLSLDDLGILRDVHIDADGAVHVDITPTYSGCPALEVMSTDIERALMAQGFPDVRVHIVLAPAWTTDWMSAAGRHKLHEYGIAPPGPVTQAGCSSPTSVSCPQCESTSTIELSRFASTPCKALFRCGECREPFDHFKPH